MATRSQKNTFLTGLLVIFAIGASVVIVVVLSGVLDTLGTSVYTVRFDLATNVGGLQPGAEVRLGGKHIGVVNAVEFVEEGGKVTGIDASIRVNKDLEIRDDAVVYLELPLLGSQGVINFPTLGEGTALAENDVLLGQLAPPSFLAQAGYGDDQRADLQNILDKTSGFADRLDAMGTSAQTTIDDARAMVADARSKWDTTWSPRVDRVTDNLDKTVAKGPQLADDLRGRLDEIQELLATAKGVIDDNRASIDETVENVRSATSNADDFTQRLNGELTDRFVELLDTGKAELEKAGDAVAKAGEIMDEQRPNIRKSLANFRLSSDQLRDTLIEVRRSPWRLLYRPDTRELEYELLYDAARTYAGALSDLRASSEALEQIVIAQQGGTVADPELVNELLAALENAFDGYRDAETLFIERIAEEAEGVGADATE